METITQLLEPHGLVVLGTLREEGGQRILVGNAGSSHWPSFRASVEFLDGRPHPMDRWSRRVGQELAAEIGARVVFPFEGPPYAPFLSWAAQSREVKLSPISLYFHRKYGLWHAYRFALITSKTVIEETGNQADISVCETCDGQPCLSACPVSAFEPGIYRVDDCVNFLRQNEASDCRHAGCQARKSCPHFQQFHYEPEHARFHMTAFLNSQTTL